MSDSLDDTEGWLRRLRKGNPAALNALIAHTCERLRRMAHRMLRGFADVRQIEATDDVLQNALIRLDSALRAETPNSAHHFYNLAAQHIRWELLDLARRYRGPRAMGGQCHNQSENDASQPVNLDAFSAPCEHPENLEEWTRFHEAVESLSDEHRELFGLLYYQGMKQAMAANFLDVSIREIKRRWRSAKLSLAQALESRSVN